MPQSDILNQKCYSFLMRNSLAFSLCLCLFLKDALSTLPSTQKVAYRRYFSKEKQFFFLQRNAGMIYLNNVFFQLALSMKTTQDGV